MSPDDARRSLIDALTVERFTHLPENVPAERAGRGQGEAHATETPPHTSRPANGPQRGAQRLTAATRNATHQEAS
jgi:hypothetical protein